MKGTGTSFLLKETRLRRESLYSLRVNPNTVSVSGNEISLNPSKFYPVLFSALFFYLPHFTFLVGRFFFGGNCNTLVQFTPFNFNILNKKAN